MKKIIITITIILFAVMLTSCLKSGDANQKRGSSGKTLELLSSGQKRVQWQFEGQHIGFVSQISEWP